MPVMMGLLEVMSKIFLAYGLEAFKWLPLIFFYFALILLAPGCWSWVEYFPLELLFFLQLQFLF